MSSSSSIVSSSSPPSSSSLSTLLQINIGQAGGQIGSLCSVYSGPLTNDGYGCLFVDSEPKVSYSIGSNYKHELDSLNR